jgi:transcriptional regulator with XRE-family HTH domain
MAAPLNVGEVFGERLRELRLKHQLTQAQVAERTGMMQNHISELEHGLRMPSLVTLLKLAAAIGCKPTDLVSQFNSVKLSDLRDK